MISENLRVATTAVATFNVTLKQEIAEIKKGKLTDALRMWYLTREDYEALDTVRKELNQLLEDMSRLTLPEIMQEEGAKTLSLDDIGRRFTVNQRASCSILDKDQGYKWLRDTGNGALIVETVNSQTLSAFAKRWVQDEGKDLPGDIFKLSVMNYMSATKI